MPYEPLVLCVPNFSEGKDDRIIKSICEVIEKYDVQVINVDKGESAGRTVITFWGVLKNVLKAAFSAAAEASKQIDMRVHTGTHPCFGATDVMPLIPLKNITLEETAQAARVLAKRIGNELSYPVYCYEKASFKKDFLALEEVRKGGYAHLQKRFIENNYPPDFGPNQFIAETGATAVGARDFLVAYNVNLKTEDLIKAKAIAKRIRQKRRDGLLPGVKAIAWYIEEYGFCQISTNITQTNQISLSEVFEEVKSISLEFDISTTGSEIIGLVPLKVMYKAGQYYSNKKSQNTGQQESFLNETDLISLAIKYLGLNIPHKFDPAKKIIEYLIPLLRTNVNIV